MITREWTCLIWLGCFTKRWRSCSRNSGEWSIPSNSLQTLALFHNSCSDYSINSGTILTFYLFSLIGRKDQRLTLPLRFSQACCLGNWVRVLLRQSPALPLLIPSYEWSEGENDNATVKNQF